MKNRPVYQYKNEQFFQIIRFFLFLGQFVWIVIICEVKLAYDQLKKRFRKKYSIKRKDIAFLLVL